MAESVEWIIEGQAFLRSYDSAPRPSPSPPSSVSNLSLFLSLPVCRGGAYWGERGGGDGREAESYDHLYKSFNTLCFMAWTVNAESFTNPNSHFVTYAANIFRRCWREFLLLLVRFTPGLLRLFARFQLNLFKPTETRFFREVGLTTKLQFSLCCRKTCKISWSSFR
jgi:hypothetical protein